MVLFSRLDRHGLPRLRRTMGPDRCDFALEATSLQSKRNAALLVGLGRPCVPGKILELGARDADARAFRVGTSAVRRTCVLEISVGTLYAELASERDRAS